MKSARNGTGSKKNLLPRSRPTGETDRKRAMARVPELDRLAQLHRAQPGVLRRLSQAIVKEVGRIETDVSKWQADRVSIALTNFRLWAGDLPLEKITSQLMEAYQRERLKEASRSTVDKELTYLVRLLRINGFTASKPKPKQGKETRQREFSAAELKQFFAQCPADLKGLFLLMLVTGARPAELIPSTRSGHVALLKKEVDFKQGLVTIRSSKALPGREGEVRTVSIPPELSQLLKTASARNPGVHVFPVILNLHRLFNRLLKSAGIEKVDALGHKVTAHSFRHTFATLMAESIGGNPFLLQRLLGHKDIKTSARYCHLKSASGGIEISEFLKPVQRTHPPNRIPIHPPQTLNKSACLLKMDQNDPAAMGNIYRERDMEKGLDL